MKLGPYRKKIVSVTKPIVFRGERNSGCMCVHIEIEGKNLFHVDDLWVADGTHRTRGEYMFIWQLRYAGVAYVSLEISI